SVAYTFSGVALAMGVLVAFDMVLWPDPAERKLLRSLADTLHHQRERLAAIGHAYLEPLAASVLPQPALVSILPAQLPVLERAQQSTARSRPARRSHDDRAAPYRDGTLAGHRTRSRPTRSPHAAAA